MQHQANLTKLGQARLELFEAFCLPTIVHQTNQDFIWDIRADPNLDPDLLNEMAALLQPYPRFFLIKSNDNNHTLESIDESTIVTGDIDHWRKTKQAQKDRSKPFVRTRLDADDGLVKNNMQHLVERMKEDRPWILWSMIPRVFYCVDWHLEWFTDHILIPRRVHHCITAGLSTIEVTQKRQEKDFIHSKVSTYNPPCAFRSSSKESDEECWIKLKDLPVAAIRARTLTSAGMRSIDPEDDQQTKSTRLAEPYNQRRAWSLMQKDFGIDEDTVLHAKEVLETQAKDIAKDNLAGQWYVEVWSLSCSFIPLVTHFFSEQHERSQLPKRSQVEIAKSHLRGR